jgi:hypothetical protein
VISSSQRPLRDNTQHSQDRDIHAPAGIRTHNLSSRAAADLRIRPGGQWDHQSNIIDVNKSTLCTLIVYHNYPIFFMAQLSFWAKASSFLNFRYHTQTHHNRNDSSGRVIGPSQRPLSANTQQSQERDVPSPVRFEPAIPARERPQTHALYRAAIGIGYYPTGWRYLACFGPVFNYVLYKGLQQAEVAQGVPGRLMPRIILTFGTTRVVGRQPYAPVAFTSGEIPGTHF